MNKKRLTALAIMMIVMMVLTIGLLAACNKGDDTSNETVTVDPTEGLVIPNSDFKVLGTDTTAYPRSISNWSGAKMYSTSTFPGDVIAGGISLEEALYNEFRTKWNDDGGVVKDGKTLYDLLKEGVSDSPDAIKNALMVYMPEKDTDLGDEDAEYGPTAYGYTSSTFTLEKNSYYKLSVDVLTWNIQGVKDEDGNTTNEPGARIYVSSNAYAEFAQIDTDGEWVTYEIYVKSPTASSTTLKLMMGLGKYDSSYSKGLTTGYAFFNNVKMDKLTDEVEDESANTTAQTAQMQWDKAVADELAQYQANKEHPENMTIQTVTMSVPNGRFDFGGKSISASSAPSGWSTVTGNSSQSDPAPTKIGTNGVINASAFADNFDKYAGTYYINTGDGIKEEKPAYYFNDAIKSNIQIVGDVVGNNVYMLSQQLMTAQGIRSSQSIVFEKNKFYDLSLNVYTYNIYGAGVSLQLTGSDGKDIVIEGVSSNKINRDNNGKTDSPLAGDQGRTTAGWVTYHFYIQGNMYKDYSYNMTLWLGTGGANENTKLEYTSYSGTGDSTGTTKTTYDADGTFSSGWVFFDEVALKEINSTEYNQKDDSAFIDSYYNKGFKIDASGDVRHIKVDLNEGSENLFGKEGSEGAGGISGSFAPNSVTSNDYSQKTQGIPAGWTQTLDDWKDNESAMPSIPTAHVNSGIVDISANSTTDFASFGVDNPKTPYEIASKYALMMQADKKWDSYYALQTDEFTIEQNGFYRLSMWVKTENVKSTSGIYVYLLDDEGSTISSFTQINTDEFDENTNDWCELTFVIRGSQLEASKVRIKVTFGTGTKYTSSTLASGAAFVTNMSLVPISYSNYQGTSSSTYLKTVDLSESVQNSFSNGTFNSYDLEDENLGANGTLDSKAGTPSNWTLSDKTNESDSLVAGIVQTNEDGTQGNHINNLFGANKTLFNNLYSDTTALYSNAPYLLALSGNGKGGNDAYSIGFTSDSFTLSANTTYRLSVWAKALNAVNYSIFLTGEASGVVVGGTDGVKNYFVEKATAASDWTEFVFYIEVGVNSISLRLNFWLGVDNDAITAADAGLDSEKSGGTVIFDYVTFNTVDEDEYDGATTDATTRKLSYNTDGFDATSSTVESRSELSSPNGWTGAADTDQDKSDTKSGIIYDNTDFIEKDEDGWLSILGSKFEDEEITFTAEEIEEFIKNNPEYEGKQDEAEEAFVKEKLEKMIEAAGLKPEELGKAHSGDRMLIINNIVDSAYAYTNSGYSLKGEKYYQISVWARTLKVDGEAQDKGAYIELNLGSTKIIDKDGDGNQKELIFNARKDAEWTEYKFYIATDEDDISSVKLKLGLGKYLGDDTDSLTTGFALFDDVTVTEVSLDEFEAAQQDETDGKNVITCTIAPASEQGGSTEPGNNQTPDNKFNLEYLCWMIPTILLGLAIIIVVIVFAVRRIKKPKKAEVIEAAKPSEIIDSKRDSYDDNRE